MMRTRKGATGLALGAVVALAAAACSSSGGGGGSATSSAAAAPQKGGTLYILNLGPHNGLDPQQSYVGADLQFAARAYARSLTTYSVGADSKLVPDLATDTGQMSDGGKTWKFTLVDTAKWQDGQKVKCEDVKYGISRTFATDMISNGPTYILSYLDVPTDADGTSAYKGPYKAAGVAEFDKAITCEGQTLTLQLQEAMGGLQLRGGLAARRTPRSARTRTRATSPCSRSSATARTCSRAPSTPNKGGTWVRNPNWDESTDKVRKAYPDKIVDVEGIQTEQVYQRLLADGGEDKTAITLDYGPAAGAPADRVEPEREAGRTINTDAPYIDYVQPNVTSEVMKDPKVRQAFAMATNRDAYVTANGGKQVMTPTYMMCNPVLKCYNKDFNPFGAPTAGDPVSGEEGPAGRRQDAADQHHGRVPEDGHP